MPVVCSDSVFAHERSSGQNLWTYVPQRGVIINPTLALGDGRVYFVESTNPATRLVADGRIKLPILLGQGADLVALDMRSGKPVWRKPAQLEAIEHMVFLSYARKRVVITGTKNVDVGKARRVRCDLAVFAADNGQRLWHNTQIPAPDYILEGPHGEQVQHPAIVGDLIYGNGFACNLHTGEPIDGWKWRKSGNCGTLSTSAACAFSRYSTPWMFDLRTGQHTVLSTTTRPGCWINIIPVGCPHAYASGRRFRGADRHADHGLGRDVVLSRAGMPAATATSSCSGTTPRYATAYGHMSRIAQGIRSRE